MSNSAGKVQPPSSKHGEFRKERKKTQIGSLLTFAVAVVALVFVMSIFFRVADISVEGNTHYTDQEIIKAIDIEEGDNLFFFDRFAAISRVFAKLPYVEEVAVSRELPNRVIITVSECKALAYIRVGDEEWTIDDNCKILGKATEDELTDLLPISGLNPGTLLIGETLTVKNDDEEVIDFVSQVLYQIQERNIRFNVSDLDFTDLNAMQFRYGTKYTVIIGGNSKIEHKFSMLESVLGKLKEGDNGIIDLSDGTTAHFIPQ